MSKNYKDTLLMPQTNFEMRANLAQKEPLIQEYWIKDNVYQTLLKNNKNNKTFILHDGPPYANGDLHLGHALNKILKDMVVRYYNSNGYYAPYIPGWDTHGLPIEQAVSKTINRKTLDSANFRKKCEEYAIEQVANQKEQFQKLGLLSDFKDYYVTFNQEYEAQQIRLFAKMVEKSVVYRNLYPVYWSPSSESALAEAEIEYINKKSPAVFIAFNLDTNILFPDAKVVIWTTTPWTIPANQLLAVNDQFDYLLIKVENKQYIIAKDLLDNFIKNCKIEKYEIIKEFKGQDLVGLTAFHPLYGRKTKLVHSDHVNLESGTGIVHIAPGFGVDDFALGLKHNITALVPIDDQGNFTEVVNDDQLVHKFYDDTNKIIVERLKASENLVALNWITHSYPHDWRTKKPVIYRATWQWFIAISKLKPEILKAIKDINFLPEWGQKRMTLMTKNRNDWCISRQRVWGVPIPIFYTEKKTAILDSKVINHVADLFAKHGSNIWYQKTAKELLPADFKHADSPNNIFYKENDIMDVWYDSGVSHLAVIKAHGLPRPVDLYLEGNDQFRGWFNSSLITGVIADGKSPYKTALAHGFVNDEKGNKMSKSIGNIISVKAICQQYGSDILRLWVASVDFQDDTRIGPEILKQISENYRKIRNLLRFLLGNLFDFDVNKVSKTDFNHQYNSLAEVDQYILIKLNNIIKLSHQYYQNYQFNNIYHLVLNFITNDLSAFYCDFTKDILYVNGAQDQRRKQVQTTMFYLVDTLIKILSPILPHTCEEAFQNLYHQSWDKRQKSLILQAFPQPLKINNGDKIMTKWDLFINLRSDVNQALTKAKSQEIIKNTLEAHVTINLKSKAKELTTISEAELAKLLIVSQADISVEELLQPVFESEISQVNVTLKTGTKCPRCWLIVDEMVNDVCLRCAAVLKQL